VAQLPAVAHIALTVTDLAVSVPGTNASVDTALVWPRPGRVQVPVLVLGAEHDGFFTAGEMDRTAAAYHTQAEILAGMGHDLMLDPGWPQVADRIHTRPPPRRPIAEPDK
jgi:pimeloyl-ACP methyl ester carboxylesterase